MSAQQVEHLAQERFPILIEPRGDRLQQVELHAHAVAAKRTVQLHVQTRPATEGLHNEEEGGEVPQHGLEVDLLK